MTEQIRRKIEHIIKIEFIRFCIVGGSGFIINFIIYTGLTKGLNVPVFFAQAIGAEIALFSNFMMHHHWTYKAHKVTKSFRKLLIQFHATTWPAIIGSALMVTGFVKLLHLEYLPSLAIASAISLVWNFFWTKYIIWRHVSTEEVERIAK
jgi:putative flippase GtrA